jgi:hypothetical protein
VRKKTPPRSRRRLDYLVVFPREPAVRIELTTARLRIECSTTELRWRSAVRRTCPDADSNRDALRHHPLKMACLPISPPGPCNTLRLCSLPLRNDRDCSQSKAGLTGLEPATSGVTDRHSNQAELQPLVVPFPSYPCPPTPHSPKGNRTPLCTVKGCRPNR